MLAPQDISIDSTALIAVQLNQSKTDQFGTGVTIFFIRISSPRCRCSLIPVHYLFIYLLLLRTVRVVNSVLEDRPPW